MKSGFSGRFVQSYLRGSWRLGTPVNDIRPRNMGANGLIFDPSYDPILKGIYGSMGLAVGFPMGLYIYLGSPPLTSPRRSE